VRLDRHAAINPGPLASLARLQRDSEPYWPQLLERIRIACGTNLKDLADVLCLDTKRLSRVALGDSEPSWSEGQVILRAAEAIERKREQG
jgi:hypothetical protein